MVATIHQLPPVATTLRLTEADIDRLEIRDAEVVDNELERITIGFGDHELVLEGADLVVIADAIAKRICEQVKVDVISARQDHAWANQHVCWCNVRLDPDQITCGGADCERAEGLDARGLVP